MCLRKALLFSSFIGVTLQHTSAMMEEKNTYNFDSCKIKRCKIKNPAGEIKIKDALNKLAKVSYEKRKWHNGCSSEINLNENGDLTIQVKKGIISQECEVDFLIELPKTCDVFISSESTHINLSEYKGNGQFESDCGNCSIISNSPFRGFNVSAVSYYGKTNNINGKTKITSGSFCGEFQNIKGDLEIDVSSCDVIANNINGKTKIKSGSGKINFKNLKGDTDINISSCSVDLQYSDLPQKRHIKISSSSTKAKIILPSNSKVHVNNLCFYKNKVKSEFVNTSQQEANYLISIRFANGNLNIEKGENSHKNYEL